MKRFSIVLALFFFLRLSCAFAQVSADCANAIPICNNTPVNGGTNGFGIDDFNGAATNGCLEATIVGSIESNSAWYRFRTGASGQLGFNIGFSTAEDWDFALYRANDCNDLGEPVRCNFFDNRDANAFMGVGEDPTGNTETFLYEDWLQVAPGEDYYLLINNFTNNNSGFSIQFSGNIFVTNPFDALDCSIINNLLGPPISACEGEIITLDATTSNATQYNWFEDTGSGFIQILNEHNSTLQVSTTALYRVQVVEQSGLIISDVQVTFSRVPLASPVSDDVLCSDVAVYDLSQNNGTVLGSQNPNEYIVSYHNSLVDAENGINFLPLEYPTNIGSETIYVRVASIDNPRCYDASQQFQLVLLQTPELNFPEEAFLCDGGTAITIGESIADPEYTYVWDSGETTSSISVSEEGTYTLTATNSLGTVNCPRSRSVSVVISTLPVIADVEIEDLQSSNTVTISVVEEGDWEYQLDDGDFQSENTFSDVIAGMHTVTVNDPRGCGSVSEQILVVGFPKFFTPNGDGSNDLWHISGIANLENPVVTIYDRYGKLLRQLQQSDAGWDGTLNGKTLPSSDYWFRLTYTDDSGQLAIAKYINNHFSLKR